MIYELQEAIKSVGFEPPEHIVAGKVHRFSTNGKRSDKSGWVLLFSDGEGAAFGCWRTGEVHNWFANRLSQADPNEQERMKREFEKAKAKAKQELEDSYRLAATEAKAIYDTARPALEHDYLSLKGIRPNMARIFGGKLILPIYDALGNIQSIQSIFSDGTKRFHAGGKMQGGHCWIGDPKNSDTILIAEGFATADSLAQATGYAVCIAFNAGNLKPVADMVYAEHGGKRLLICADNDKHGAGADKAIATGYEYIICPVDGDFNDMALASGLESVKNAIDGVAQPESFLVNVEDIMKSVTKPDWIIKGILERNSSNLLFGEPGAGKSLFALDWAFCIGTGRSWHGHLVKEPMSVVYIAGEGHRGLAMRMQALSQKYDDKPKNIFFSRKSVDMISDVQVEVIAKIVKETCANPAVVFIDTLHRNMVGDENSSEDIAKYFKSIEHLQKQLGCAIVTVHHSGHGDKTRARGSSSIKAGVDAEFCVSKEGKSAVFACTKSKDFSAGSDMRFGILEVSLEGPTFYDDDEDKQVTSVYLDYLGVEKTEPELQQNHAIVLDLIRQSITEAGTSGAGKTIRGELETVVTKDIVKSYVFEVFTDKNRWRKFDASINYLMKQSLIFVDGDYIWTTSPQ
jgi:phage/plasmid primase-like uncharacterized protein/KaiC/GvpD/RAD55 family RecA-like ATPase